MHLNAEMLLDQKVQIPVVSTKTKLLMHKNKSGSLGEQEMLWQVSPAF